MNHSPLTVGNMSSISEDMERRQGNPAQLIFFRRLHAMITNESHSGFIVWLPDGLGFAIPSKQPFANSILPLYFFQSKFSAFTRRLKRWGFVRQSEALGLEFRHDQFRRDMVFDDVFDFRSQHSLHLVGNNNTSSLSKGPLKKRFKERSPPSPPVRLSPSSAHVEEVGLLPSNDNSDVHIMQELLRVISKKKRKERKKRNEEIMVAHTLASLDLQGRKNFSPSFIGCVECIQPSLTFPTLMKPKIFSFGRAA